MMHPPGLQICRWPHVTLIFALASWSTGASRHQNQFIHVQNIVFTGNRQTNDQIKNITSGLPVWPSRDTKIKFYVYFE